MEIIKSSLKHKQILEVLDILFTRFEEEKVKKILVFILVNKRNQDSRMDIWINHMIELWLAGPNSEELKKHGIEYTWPNYD